jgi:glycosyltransferase involved in cell wall biosynthesis
MNGQLASFGVVAIGRNEGDRLKQCILSLPSTAVVVYVDSGSTDASNIWARQAGADVVDLDLSLPFTAARARNAGFIRLLQIDPHVSYVQFIDGDCQLVEAWPAQAIRFLEANGNVGAVLGRRRERYPHRSIYNQLCDWEWNGPIGEVGACGGDVMIRACAFQGIGGYRNDLIAGEEPELCVRLRAAGWKIFRLDNEMTLHDANILHISQWLRRAMRGGYAFAQGAHLHGAAPESHWVWESRRAWIWGWWLPIACLVAGVALWPWGFSSFLIFPLQIVRLTLRKSGSLEQRFKLAVFQTLARFPEALGQIRFLFDRMLARRATIIEYK